MGSYGWPVARQAVLLTNRVLFFQVSEKQTHNQEITIMSESFAELFEESLNQTVMNTGNVIIGTVADISDGYVIVSAGLKSEGVIPVSQFTNLSGELEVAVGDEVEVVLEAVEDGYGETRLSREKAKRAKAWITLEKSFESEEIITGIITGKVKGGFTVELGDIRAFLPGSLVDVRPVRDTSYLEGKELEFKVIKLTRNATTSWYHVVLWLKTSTAKNVSSCSTASKKANRSKVWLKILPITARSWISVVSTVCYISLIWRGNAYVILQRSSKWARKSKSWYSSSTKRNHAFLWV